MKALVGEAEAGLAKLLRASPRLALYISDGSWLCRDEKLDEIGKAAHELALSLHQRGLVAVEFVRPLNGVQLSGLAQALGELRRTNTTLNMVDEVKTRTAGGAQLIALRTDGLKLVQSSGGPRSGQVGGAREWRTILEDLFSGGATGAGAAQSAAEISAHLNASDAATVRAMHGELGRLAAAASADASSPALEKLRQLVRGLAPSARDALLGASEADPALALPFLSTVADELSLEQIVSSVRMLGDGGPASKDTVMMFEGLARLAHTRGANMGAFVNTLEKWKDASGSGEAGDEIGRILRELMTMRRYADFTPEDYRAQLESATAALGAAPNLCRLAPVDSSRTQAQAAAVAAMVCRDCDWHDLTKVLEQVERGVDAMVRENRFDLLCIVRGAAARGARAGTSAGVSARLDEKLKAPDVLRAALAHAVAPDTGMDAREFAVRSGPAGVVSLLRAAGEADEQVRRELLRTALVGIDAQAMLDSIKAAAAVGEEHLAMLLEEVCSVRGPGAAQVFRNAVRTSDDALAICIIRAFPDAQDDVALALYGEALRHPSTLVGLEALRRSFEDGPEKRHAELVRRYLAFELDPANMAASLVELAVATLLKSPKHGHAAAGRVIEAACKSWKLRALSIASLLVAALGAVETTDESARRAVLRWRLSLNGLVGNTLRTLGGSGRRAHAA